MGIYQFNCREHGIVEVWQGINEDHTEVCPVCKKPATRLFNSPVIMGDVPGVWKDKANDAEREIKRMEAADGC